jgi:hypothetical protein
MTPVMWAALWRYNLIAEQLNELGASYRAKPFDTWPLRSVQSYLKQVPPLFVKDGSELAVEHLLDEAARYLRYAEQDIVVERRKRANPEVYCELHARILAVINTPVPGIPEARGVPYLGKTKEIEAAIEALEGADFAKARHWCEEAERTLPEAIRAREEEWREQWSSWSSGT